MKTKHTINKYGQPTYTSEQAIKEAINLLENCQPAGHVLSDTEAIVVEMLKRTIN